MKELYLWMTLFLSICSVPAFAQTTDARRSDDFDLPPRIATQQLVETYRLGFNAYVSQSSHPGLLVASINDSSPTRNMHRVDSPNIRGILENGDIVTHVNGSQIRSLNDYYSIMDRTTGEEVVLSIVDKNTNKAFQWSVKPTKVVGKLAQIEAPTTNRVAHVRLIGLTDDESIGESISVSLNDLRIALESAVPRERLDLKLLEGSDCSFYTVMQELDSLRSSSNPADSIFVYYMGHGAYDPRYGSGDPSGGHFFQMPQIDLLRRQLYEKLLTVPGRFHGLVSDTCNVRGEATIHMIPYDRYTEMRTMTLTGPSNIEQLLLYHSGELDVSSTSKDQFGWASRTKGMFFSIHFVPTISKNSDWQSVISESGDLTNSFFQEVKAYARSRRPSGADATEENLRNWKYMQDQDKMTPASYRMAIEKDQFVETRPETTIQVPVWVMPHK